MAWVPLLSALLAIGALVGMFFAWRREKERVHEMYELAKQLGLQFDPHENARHEHRYVQFAIFQRGRNRKACNSLRGELPLFDRPCRVVLGDFRYEESDSESSTTNRFSYLIVHPPWRSPSLLVRPERLLDKLKGTLGFGDIDFESQEFSRRFWVESDDKRFAYDVLHPRMMQLLLANDPPMLVLAGGALCVSDGKGQWSPAQFRSMLEFLRQFAAQWPRHLAQQLET